LIHQESVDPINTPVYISALLLSGKSHSRKSQNGTLYQLSKSQLCGSLPPASNGQKTTVFGSNIKP
jgi:hypothetical protein